MVINSTNINKTVTSHLKKTMTYDVGNPCPGMGRTEKCVCVGGGGGGEVKLVNGIPTYMSDQSF